MKQVLKKRTKKFAGDCWKACEKFPLSREYNAYYRQLIQCSSSVDTNHRASCRAKSDAHFINKLKIGEEEAEESMYFIESFFEISIKEESELKRLYAEANELLVIVVSSIKIMLKLTGR